MASVVISGDTSGSIALAAPAVAGSGTLTLPVGTGVVSANGVSSNIVAATAQASTSGTSIDFTSIPSWVKRITIMFAGVSTSGTSAIQVQLGDSGGIENTGYVAYLYNANGPTSLTPTTGFAATAAAIAAATYLGHMQITNLNGNSWVSSSIINATIGVSAIGAGTKTLSDVLTQVRITTVNGTDTFDAGSINILYE